MPRPTSAAPQPRCVELASVFQNPLLEEPPAGRAGVAERRQYNALVARAEQTCRDCPLIERCLYAAVVQHDVAGFVGGTTPAERARIRRALRVTVTPEDFDTLAGVTGGHRLVDHDEVVRLRHAHPDESLETIARRLGCSLSTVKRHLRRERRNPGVRREESSKPSVSAVLAAAAAVTGRSRTHLAA
jgi:transcription factor WhiB/sigma-70-like protein